MAPVSDWLRHFAGLSSSERAEGALLVSLCTVWLVTRLGVPGTTLLVVGAYAAYRHQHPPPPPPPSLRGAAAARAAAAEEYTASTAAGRCAAAAVKAREQLGLTGEPYLSDEEWTPEDVLAAVPRQLRGALPTAWSALAPALTALFDAHCDELQRLLTFRRSAFSRGVALRGGEPNFSAHYGVVPGDWSGAVVAETVNAVCEWPLLLLCDEHSGELQWCQYFSRDAGQAQECLLSHLIARVADQKQVDRVLLGWEAFCDAVTARGVPVPALVREWPAGPLRDSAVLQLSERAKRVHAEQRDKDWAQQPAPQQEQVPPGFPSIAALRASQLPRRM